MGYRIQKSKPTRCTRVQGKKGEPLRNPGDPPRKRANKNRGRGTYENDRPPVVGMVGRRAGWACFRVCVDTTQETIRAAVAGETAEEACIFTDENRSYLWLESFYGLKAKRNPEAGELSITPGAGPRTGMETASGRFMSVQPEGTRRACVTACGAFAGFTKATYPDT